MSSDIPPSAYLDILPAIILNAGTTGSILYVEIAAIFVLLIINGMVASSEVAFFALTPQDKENIKNDDNPRNDLILDLLDKPRYVLSTVLIVISLLNITVVLLSHLVISSFFPAEMPPIQIGSYSFSASYIEEGITLMVDIFFILLFVDVIPITFAQSNKLKVAAFMAPLLNLLMKICYPLSYFMVNTSTYIERKIRRYTDIDTDEIEQAIEMTADEDTTQQDINVLKGIVHFGEITARQIMKPRMDIHALDMQWNFNNVLEYIKSSGYSRLPVFEGTIDKIKGVLHVKDILTYLDQDESFNWHNLLSEALFIPETKRIDVLLKDIKATRKHMAIVVDEHGGTCGLITLEDIVEEVLGDIKDEFDEDEEFISSKVNENTYIFDGKVLLNDVCKIIRANVDDFDDVRGESDSLGGLLLEMAGKMPSRYEIFHHKRYHFKVLQLEQHRIKRVQIELDPLEDTE